MLIGIISDTHDHAENFIKAVKIFNEKKVGLVVHCGDWVSPFMPDFCADLQAKVVSVFGNNEGDIFRFLTRKEKNGWNIEFDSKCVELEIDNRKIIVYHGDCKPLLMGLIESGKYDAVFSGHTHEKVIQSYGKTLHVNPGSICGISYSKLVDDITVAIYDSVSNSAEFISIK